jgi:hypothetical protein
MLQSRELESLSLQFLVDFLQIIRTRPVLEHDRKRLQKLQTLCPELSIFLVNK